MDSTTPKPRRRTTKAVKPITSSITPPSKWRSPVAPPSTPTPRIRGRVQRLKEYQDAMIGVKLEQIINGVSRFSQVLWRVPDDRLSRAEKYELSNQLEMFMCRMIELEARAAGRGEAGTHGPYWLN